MSDAPVTTSPATPGKKPTLTVCDKAVSLILEYEDIDHGGWPGGASGCTIGYGYDLGFHTLGQFAQDWKARLSVNDFAKLRALVGVTGTRARDRVRVLGTVSLTKEDARAVFYAASLPRAVAATLAVFPGVESLPENAAGALVSLVFNRGSRLSDNDPQLQERREMRAIREAVVAGDLMEIAIQLRSMVRLWEGKGLGGLIRRREAEATLVETCIKGGAAGANPSAPATGAPAAK